MARNLAIFFVQNDGFHISTGTIALIRGPGVLRGEDAETLNPAPFKVLHLVVVNMSRPPVPILRLAPLIGLIGRHNQGEFVHLRAVAVVRSDKVFPKSEVVEMPGGCIDR